MSPTNPLQMQRTGVLLAWVVLLNRIKLFWTRTSLLIFSQLHGIFLVLLWRM